MLCPGLQAPALSPLLRPLVPPDHGPGSGTRVLTSPPARNSGLCRALPILCPSGAENPRSQCSRCSGPAGPAGLPGQGPRSGEPGPCQGLPPAYMQYSKKSESFPTHRRDTNTRLQHGSRGGVFVKSREQRSSLPGKAAVSHVLDVLEAWRWA